MTEQNAQPAAPESPTRLRDALRKARIEAADRTGVVVELRDAEVARLEILNDALNPLFEQIPAQIDLFDRGISQGGTPRLWIDALAHIAMGRDKRTYRFVHDTRFGRSVIAQSNEVAPIVDAVTEYIARRMIEREQAMAVPITAAAANAPQKKPAGRFWTFVLGFVVGAAALFGVTLISLRALS